MLKVQINSLEALERLIGGDTQIEIDIRDNIVDIFTRKHLKSIANEQFVKDATEALSNQMKDQFLVYSSGMSLAKIPKLNPEIEKLIKEDMIRLGREQLREIVDDVLNATKTRYQIEEVLTRQANYILDELTNNKLEDRLEAMVDRRLKVKLGIKT